MIPAQEAEAKAVSVKGPDDLDGALLARESPEYEAARTRNFALNAHDPSRRGSHAFPSYIAVVKSIQDVQKCLRYASSQGLTVTVRSGGHNWFGCYLRQDGLLIDMSHFDSIRIDPAQRTATVGPCALGQSLNEIAAEHGLCFPTGHCVGVPVGGFLLGGGLGWFIPHYGYAAESLLAVTVVDASGRVVEAKADSNEEAEEERTSESEEWMWLARGAASAFPGVVVSFKVRLHPLPKVIKSRLELYPLESFEAMVGFFHEHVMAHPESSAKLELTAVMACTPPPLVDVVKVPKLLMVMVVGIADSVEEFNSMVRPLQEAPAAPFFPSAFEDHESFRSLPELLREAYPPGTHWANRCLLGGPEQFRQVDWTRFRESFVKEAPMGPSHAMAIIAPQNPVNSPGCYGPVRPGLAVLIVGAYSRAEGRGGGGGEEEQHRALRFVSAMEEVAEPGSLRYGALEHPVNRHTFSKAFGTCAERLESLRSKLDPAKLFFDPSTAEPSH